MNDDKGLCEMVPPSPTPISTNLTTAASTNLTTATTPVIINAGKLVVILILATNENLHFSLIS